MVKRWNQKCLILLAVTFSFLFARTYAAVHVVDQERLRKDIENKFQEIKIGWQALTSENRAKVLDKVFLGNNSILLTPEVLRDQYNKLDRPEQFANELLDPNSQNPQVKLTPDVLLDQYNKLDEPEKFLNTLLTENSTRNVKVKLDPQVLKEQYNKLDKPDEFLSRLLIEKETPLQEILASSEPMILLFKKIQVFVALIEKQDFEKAAIVSDDIQTTIKNFDPSLFFPKLFSHYFALTAAHSDVLSNALNNKTSLKWEALNRLYQTDVEEFIQW